MKQSLVALAVSMLAMLTAACVPGGDGGDGERPDDTVKLVRAPIDRLDVLVRESSPPGYTLQIASGLPSGCARFDSARITGRSDAVVTVEVLNSVPADEDVACTAIYGTHETNVDLGTDFESGRTYAVEVNGERTTFAAQ